MCDSVYSITSQISSPPSHFRRQRSQPLRWICWNFGTATECAFAIEHQWIRVFPWLYWCRSVCCVIQKCSNYRGMRHVVGQGGDHQISLGKLHGKFMRYPRENLSFQLPWDATIPWACTLVGISLSENDLAFTSEVNISGLYLNQRDHS